MSKPAVKGIVIHQIKIILVFRGVCGDNTKTKVIYLPPSIVFAFFLVRDATAHCCVLDVPEAWVATQQLQCLEFITTR